MVTNLPRVADFHYDDRVLATLTGQSPNPFVNSAFVPEKAQNHCGFATLHLDLSDVVRTLKSESRAPARYREKVNVRLPHGARLLCDQMLRSPSRRDGIARAATAWRCYEDMRRAICPCSAMTPLQNRHVRGSRYSFCRAVAVHRRIVALMTKRYISEV